MSYDWEDEFENRYMEGFKDGYKKAMSDARRDLSSDFGRNARKSPPAINMRAPKGTKKARRQSAKQKLLTQLADKKWKSYKRKYPKGKKTYITIRAQVSRSQIYKKKAKRLG